MSAVTLESLRADFEAKLTELKSVYGIPYPHEWMDYSYSFWHKDIVNPTLADFCVLQCEYADEYDLRKAANLYHVARDHGLEAAMLFKLSDGAIDPRKDGAE